LIQVFLNGDLDAKLVSCIPGLISKLFGTTGLSSALDTVEFDDKAREISRDHPEFDPYFQTHLKDRLREYVNIPKRQLRHDRLWTNNNCESMNHIFKRAVNWTPKSIPELIQNLHDIVKVQLIDMKRSLFGTGNYELL
jgi:hypothetical protein